MRGSDRAVQAAEPVAIHSKDTQHAYCYAKKANVNHSDFCDRVYRYVAQNAANVTICHYVMASNIACRLLCLLDCNNME